MNDSYNFAQGYFKAEIIDSNNNILDVFEDKNMIMNDARKSMQEMFLNQKTNTFITGIKLGTKGHVGSDVLVPKQNINGFVKERTKMFSEYTTYSFGQTISLMLNDCIFITDNSSYYIYTGLNAINIYLDEATLSDTNLWTKLDEKPFVYNLNFKTNGQTAGSATEIVEDDPETESTVSFSSEGTSVTYVFEIYEQGANGQNIDGSSVFTEACLIVNNRIFAMKTFKAKVKDSSVILRITWTIIF